MSGVPCKTEWHDSEETFTFMAHSFDVGAAKRILREKGESALVLPLPVQSAATFLGFIGIDPVEDWSTINLDVPVILVTVKGSHLPIDGWHRITKALNEGRETIPCVILDEKETKKVQNAQKRRTKRK